MEALETALEVLESRATELAASAEIARQARADSSGAAGTLEAWTTAIARHNEATSAIYWTKAVIAQLEAEAATPEARMDYLVCFSDDALAAMATGGYWNDGNGKLETATLEEVAAVHAYRTERNANWLAETLANEVAGDPNSYSAVVASDTMGDPLYSLQVNGAPSKHGAHVTKWGIAYAVCREMMAAGIDPDSNTGAIGAVLKSRQDGSSVILGDLEFSVTFESEA